MIIFAVLLPINRKLPLFAMTRLGSDLVYDVSVALYKYILAMIMYIFIIDYIPIYNCYCRYRIALYSIHLVCMFSIGNDEYG